MGKDNKVTLMARSNAQVMLGAYRQQCQECKGVPLEAFAEFWVRFNLPDCWVTFQNETIQEFFKLVQQLARDKKNTQG